MKSVVVSTYNETDSPAGFVTIYSTDQPQQKISSKAIFHLMKDITISLDSILANANLTNEEFQKVRKTESVFEVTRTSITLDHIIARRIAASTASGVFVTLINLQQKTMTLKNMEFRVSGTLASTSDPMNIHMENIYVDQYSTISGFSFETVCNYPEAYLTPTVTVNNLTIDSSFPEAEVTIKPPYFFYSGPGNVTAKFWNATNGFSLETNTIAGSYIFASQVCSPPDGILRTFDVDTYYGSIRYNDDGKKGNNFIIGLVNGLGRIHRVQLSNFFVEDYDSSYMGITVRTQPSDTVILSNIVATRYSASAGFLWLHTGSKLF
ncbi:unnamed protein product [Moneuplotes crassus]|uniref:Uncharacterized protein n=1 Tax=Euplotes crassus TaxID=5936 RepID=A0AAD1UJP4_EUPCR|nr:unnamed protein product [Moneuplotes crassus]